MTAASPQFRTRQLSFRQLLFDKLTVSHLVNKFFIGLQASTDQNSSAELQAAPV
jgi:hypothetical protein